MRYNCQKYEWWWIYQLMSEFYEKYLLCEFFVRSKSYTFLESLGYCKKKLDMLSNFFSDILRIFRARIWWRQVLCSVKNQTCLHVTFSNRKIIQYWSLFTKRLGCLLFLFLSYGVRNEIWWRHNLQFIKNEVIQNVTYISIKR